MEKYCLFWMILFVFERKQGEGENEKMMYKLYFQIDRVFIKES